MAPMALADSIFLMLEKREQPMHVGGMQLYELPDGADEDWVRNLYSEIVAWPEVASLFRRRPYRPVTSLGAWSWQVDDDVDLEHHVRHSALPRPGRVRELLALVSRLHGTLLDRHRPLWEAHLIEGLEGRRFAVYTKIHHSLMDGVSALKLLERSQSSDPDARDIPPPYGLRPRRPSSAARAPGGIADLLDVPVSALHSAAEIVALVPILAQTALRTLRDQSAVLPTRVPRTMFNVPITGARRFAAQSWPMAQFRAVASATGTTINDVVLAVCSAALRSYLEEQGALPEAPMVAMTPVSLRRGEGEMGGNAVGVILCSLASDVTDPLDRLAAIHRSMELGKEYLRSLTQLQATVVSALALLPGGLSFVPGVRQIAPLPYNVVISNIPGPRTPLYWNGARLQGVYPLSIPTDGQALNITLTSYNETLDFGLTGCRRTVPHLQRMLTYLDDGLAELTKLSRA